MFFNVFNEYIDLIYFFWEGGGGVWYRVIYFLCEFDFI